MDAAEQKLEVIRKLLAKAERAATPGEADAYNTKAAELMARHGVDSAMLAAASGNVADRIGERRIALTDPYSTEKAGLAGSIAGAMGCRAVRHLGRGRGQTAAVTVMGFESDLSRVELVFTSLLLQATRAVVRQRPPAWTGESTAAFRRTWLAGFTVEVSRRLEAAQKGAVAQHDAAAASGTASAALVLADRRTLVERAFQERFANLRAGRSRRLSGSGYSAGVEAGRRADVGQPRMSGARRALDR